MIANRMMSSEKKDLLVRVAWSYYILDLTQQEVGERLNISRQKVQRLLEEANQEEIVQVEINSPHSNLLSIEDTLRRSFSSLEDAVVMPFVDSDLRDHLGHAAATYVERLITDNQVKSIGTGWGKTMRSFVDHFYPKTQDEEMDVVSLAGNLQQNTGFNTYTIADSLARKLSASCYNIWAPSIVRDEARADMFKSEPWIEEVLEKAKSVDLVVVSIGQVSEEATLKELGYLDADDIQHLRSLNAAGDILSQFFTNEGSIVNSKFQDIVIALPIEALKDSDKKVIGVAGGQHKLEAIRGSLNGNFVDILITDEKIAKAL